MPAKHLWISFCLAVCAAFLAEPAQAASFFVSPKGSDAAPGTTALRPFATLDRAQAAARRARSHGPVTVYLRGGTYSLARPLVFTPEDSGTPQAPVLYRPYLREKPVLSGAVPLHLTWTPYKNGIFQARLTAAQAALPIDQLFVNGALQHMARYPNYDPKAQYYDGASADALSPQRIKGWADPTGGYVHALHGYHWGSQDYRILGKNPDGTLKLEGGWQNNRPSDFDHNTVFVENVFEELDAPGEWYLDKAKGILYLMPEAGVDIDKARVEGAVLTSLVEFRGSPQSPVRFVSLQGLTLTQTVRTFMLTKEPLLRSDWRIYRGGATFLQGTESCGVRDCDFLNVGGNAVFVSDYNRHATISGCKITEAGTSGICFVGDPAAVRDPLFNYGDSLSDDKIDTTPGPKMDNYPADCTASDNLITRIGRIEKQSAGVEIDMAQDITVSHCSIYDVPRSGINIGDGCWGGHVIKYCDVFDTVKETGDHGSFNSWGRDRYWMPDRGAMDRRMAAHPDWFKLDVVKPITLRDTRWVCHHGWDIDLDDGSTNYIIVNNLCLGGGIKNREGAYRVNENNVIPNNSFNPHVWFHDSQDVFAHNIVGQGYHPAGDFQPWWGKELDDNAFLNAGDLRAAQGSGHDPHSVAGDPMYVNPATGDFRVKEGSPALQVGFKNFPMDRFGVVSPRLRAQAKNGLDFANVKSQDNGPTRDATVRVWLGAKVKNVTELGEQSMAGLPAISGVLILNVPTAGVAAKAGLRKFDVLWTVDGQPAPDYAALVKRASAVPSTASTASVQVYRGQKIVTLQVPTAALVPPATVTLRVKTSGASPAAFEADLDPAGLIALSRPGSPAPVAEKTSNPGGGTNADAVRNGTTKNGTGGDATQDDGKTFRGYGEGDTVTFPLNVSANKLGYDLTKIVTFAGHFDSRASQNYTVLVAFVADPSQFVTLVPSASAACGGGASEVTITDSHGGILRGDRSATGVAAVRFDFHDGSVEAGGGVGYNLYREIQIIGTPTGAHDK